jgi:large subunit ribosomal protein L9
MASFTQIILSRDVPNLGRLGEIHKVRAGYARNFLFPKGMALPASSNKVKEFEHQKKLVAHRMKLVRSESERKAAELSQHQFALMLKVGSGGKVFGAITSRDIAQALAESGYVIDHRDLKLEAPIRTIGSHEVPLRLEADVSTSIKIVIGAEQVEDHKFKSVEELEAEEDQLIAEKAINGDVDIEAEEAALAVEE